MERREQKQTEQHGMEYSLQCRIYIYLCMQKKCWTDRIHCTKETGVSDNNIKFLIYTSLVHPQDISMESTCISELQFNRWKGIAERALNIEPVAVW